MDLLLLTYSAHSATHCTEAAPLVGWCLFTDIVPTYKMSDVQVCHQHSAFDLLLIFLCSLIQILTLTPPPNNANMDM